MERLQLCSVQDQMEEGAWVPRTVDVGKYDLNADLNQVIS